MYIYLKLLMQQLLNFDLHAQSLCYLRITVKRKILLEFFFRIKKRGEKNTLTINLLIRASLSLFEEAALFSVFLSKIQNIKSIEAVRICY